MNRQAPPSKPRKETKPSLNAPPFCTKAKPEECPHLPSPAMNPAFNTVRPAKN